MSGEGFELVRLKSGVMSLRALSNLETFHPVTGPVIEAEILHVAQPRLVARARSISPFIVWDVGLGAGANALAAIRALTAVGSPVEIHSFDQTTEPLTFALTHAESLRYPLGFESAIERLLAHGCVDVSPKLRWVLHRGDFTGELGGDRVPSPHSILYDPYSSARNPEMWSLDHFLRLYSALDPRVPCLLTNYTRSTAVRVTLLLAGFTVGTGCAVGEKSETTLAANDPGLIEDPLSRRWLERVRASRNSAPLRTGGRVGVEKISEADFEQLRTLPQFSSNV